MGEITLPSGLVGVIRELGVQDENVLIDPKLARSGKNLHQVFRNIWAETVDPGVYHFENGFDPTLLFQGDGVALLIYVRIETYGSVYYFDVNCPYCQDRIQWQMDLKEFMEQQAKKFSESALKVIKEKKGIFEDKFPKCGKKFSYRLITLKDELRFPQIRREAMDKLSSVLLDLSITDIEGVKLRRPFLGLEPYPKEFDGVREYLSSADANHFRQVQEDASCGVITRFEIECPRCGEVPVDFPFREDFLLPRKRKQ